MINLMYKNLLKNGKSLLEAGEEGIFSNSMAMFNITIMPLAQPMKHELVPVFWHRVHDSLKSSQPGKRLLADHRISSR